jgi:hypothetical protein
MRNSAASVDLVYSLMLSVGGLFLVSGTSKLLRPRQFAETVVQYEILPPRVARIWAAALIPIELAVGTSLVASQMPVRGAAVGLCLVFLFAAAATVNLRRGRIIECGCFGDARKVTGTTLARLSLLGAAFTAILLTPAMGIVPDSGRTLLHISTIGNAVSIAALAVGWTLVGLWISEFDELKDIFRNHDRAQTQGES